MAGRIFRADLFVYLFDSAIKHLMREQYESTSNRDNRSETTRMKLGTRVKYLNDKKLVTTHRETSRHDRLAFMW